MCHGSARVGSMAARAGPVRHGWIRDVDLGRLVCRDLTVVPALDGLRGRQPMAVRQSQGLPRFAGPPTGVRLAVFALSTPLPGDPHTFALGATRWPPLPDGPFLTGSGQALSRPAHT